MKINCYHENNNSLIKLKYCTHIHVLQHTTTNEGELTTTTTTTIIHVIKQSVAIVIDVRTNGQPLTALTG